MLRQVGFKVEQVGLKLEGEEEKLDGQLVGEWLRSIGVGIELKSGLDGAGSLEWWGSF